MNDLQSVEAAVHQTLDNYSAERDLMNQLLGQAQMASAFGDFCRTIGVSKLAYVKENKLYRALRGKPTPNGSEFSGTWAEFCELLGVSPDKADTDIANLRAFGEQALEAMSKMGIGYRDMAKFRRLPEDSRQALAELSQTGDKGTVLELAEELLAKQEAEKAKVEAALAEAREDLEAKDTLAGERERRIEHLSKELRKARGERQRATPAQEESRLRDRAQTAVLQCRADISARGEDVASLAAAIDDLRAHAAEQGNAMAHDAYLGGLVGEVLAELRRVRDEIGLPIVGDYGDPNWSVGA